MSNLTHTLCLDCGAINSQFSYDVDYYDEHEIAKCIDYDEIETMSENMTQKVTTTSTTPHGENEE